MVDRHDDVAYLVGIVDAGTEGLVQHLELLARPVLPAISLHDLLPGHHLLYESVHFAKILLPLHEVFLTQLAQPGGHPVDAQRHDHCYQGQGQTEYKHTDQSRYNGDNGFDQVRNAAADDLTDSVHVVGVNRHHVTMRVRVEIPQRQALHMCEKAVAKTAHSPLSDKNHKQVMQVTADDTHKKDGA